MAIFCFENPRNEWRNNYKSGYDYARHAMHLV